MLADTVLADRPCPQAADTRMLASSSIESNAQSLQTSVALLPPMHMLQVEAGPVDPEQYANYRALTDLREPYRRARLAALITDWHKVLACITPICL